MIILALDTILGSQILFTNGYEKRITVYTVFAGLLNLGLNSLPLFQPYRGSWITYWQLCYQRPLYLFFYIISSIENNFFNLGHIF